MGRIKQNNLIHNPYNVNNKSQKEIDKFFQVAENMLSSDYEERQMQIYKDNFISSLEDVAIDDNSPEFKKLLYKIESLSLEELYQMYMENDDMDLEFWYNNETITKNERANRILSQIEKWQSNNSD